MGAQGVQVRRLPRAHVSAQSYVVAAAAPAWAMLGLRAAFRPAVPALHAQKKGALSVSHASLEVCVVVIGRLNNGLAMSWVSNMVRHGGLPGPRCGCMDFHIRQLISDTITTYSHCPSACLVIQHHQHRA